MGAIAGGQAAVHAECAPFELHIHAHGRRGLMHLVSGIMMKLGGGVVGGRAFCLAKM